MRIVDIYNFRSRNIYSHKPVIKMIIDLEELYDTSTKKLGDFNDLLLKYFPGLKNHFCSPGYKGGFVERLQEGTLVSHVIEHLAIELQCLLGYDVSFGKTRIYKEPSMFYIIYEYNNEYCAKEFGYAAQEIISSLLRYDTHIIGKAMDRLNQMVEESELGPSTKAIWEEAKRRNIPIRRIGMDSLLQLGYGCQMRLIEASLPDNTSCIAVDLAKNKQLAKKILQEQLIPVPDGDIAESEKEAVNLAEKIGYPVVIKPLDANQGKGVSANLGDEKAVRAAYRLASDYGKQILIEKYIKGRDYRILVVGDHVAAATERKPPFVIGDGVHSIVELVNEENKNPNRGIGHTKPLSRINLDLVTEDFLFRSGFEVDDIPSPGQYIYLRENGNLSTGGSSRDCTAEIHPFNASLAVKAAKVIGLDISGIDVVMEDISKPLTSCNGSIIEINAAPGLRMHLSPMEGQGRNVAADIFDVMYPKGKASSIPIISITGTNGKTTVARMISHILSLTGQKIGMTCSVGTYIGKECISQGDNTGAGSARLILYNQEVEIAVLETARGGIIRSGLGYDLADIGIITNITDDHLGQDGIDTLEDLAFVKSLVVEAVKTSGYAVLNADDEMTDYIISKVKCNIILFGRNVQNKLLSSHICQGGTAVVVENGQILIYKNRIRTEIMVIEEIPVTFDGKAICNIENSLAVIAGLIALRIPEQTIRIGMTSFKPDTIANAGRFNLFDLGEFRVLIDYGHNRRGYQSVIEFISALNAERLVGIIGVPGDRLNQSIIDVGEIAGQAFSQIYIKEDQDLRGRTAGEVANLLYMGAVSAGANPDSIKTFASETDALKQALASALPGDLIVLFYEHFDSSLAIIEEYLFEAERKPRLLYPVSDIYRPINPYVPQVLH